MWLIVGGSLGLLVGCGGGVSQEDMRRHAIRRPDDDESNSNQQAARKDNKRAKKEAGNKQSTDNQQENADNTPASTAADTASNTSGSAKSDPRSSDQSAAQAVDGTAAERDAARSAAKRPTPSKPLNLVERRQRTIDNLTRIGKAIRRYCKENGHLFAPAIRHSRGQPVLSWRVELLPCLGHEDLYQQFDHTEAWDSDRNKRLLTLIPDVYQSPERFDERTNYLIPTGSFTAFNRPQRGIPVRKFEDGLENTVVLLEADDAAAVPWTKPEDLKIDLKTFHSDVGSLRSDGFFVVWGDGAVTRVTRKHTEADLKAIFTFDAHDMFVPELVRAAPTETPAPVQTQPTGGATAPLASEADTETVAGPPAAALAKAAKPRAMSEDAAGVSGKGTRVPIPEARSLQRAQALVREIYEDDYEKSKTTQDKQELAQRMLEQVPEMVDDPAGQYVLLDIAIEIALQIGDAVTATDAMQRVLARFEMGDLERLEFEHHILQQLSKRKDRSQATNQVLLERAGTFIRNAMEAEAFETAENMCRIALAAARQLDLQREAAALHRQQRIIEEARKAYDTIRRTVATLEDGDDPRANLQVGRYYCFIRGEWPKGLPLLAKGSHAILKELAQIELSEPTDAVEQLELADGWWELSSEETTHQKTLRLHAVEWYLRALEGLPQSLVKVKAELRVKQVERDYGSGAVRPVGADASN